MLRFLSKVGTFKPRFRPLTCQFSVLSNSQPEINVKYYIKAISH